MTVASPTPTDERRGLAALSIDELLRDQQTLARPATAADEETVPEIPAVAGELESTEAAVETFARLHADPARPLQERYYRSLLPTTPLEAGEQYAFEVDLDACSGCKACVVACHSLNGLDEDESWRDVGLLQTPPDAPVAQLELPVLQHVTTACHHCVDPGCLRGCPVNAYEKDPTTGIVRHLDDQCFGCQYCTLMCPYEVPKYNERLGIVRKCDLCSDRLAEGEAPACVQSCPHEAIRIRKVSQQGVKAVAARASACGTAATSFALPYAPPAQQTVPTTVYRTERLNLESLEPADLRTPRPAHAHGPLTIMLALTQVGVGGLIAAAVLWMAGFDATAWPLKIVTLAGFAILNAGLAAATLHLGRPHLAFRAVLGWRHSWLSREAIAFGLLMPPAAAAVALTWSDWLLPLTGRNDDLSSLAGPVLMTAGGLGLAAVFTSVMIYVAARKPLWSPGTTTLRFALTTTLGAAGLAWIALLASGQPSFVAAVVVGLAVAAKLWLDAQALLGDDDDQSAVLLQGDLRKVVGVRLGVTLAGLGGVLLVTALASGGPIPTAAGVLALGLLVAGELVERWLFFTAVTGPKMPGGLPA